jgi:4-amino-4-deoxy-L-arabinose transferase-like glycosyltransferase
MLRPQRSLGENEPAIAWPALISIVAALTAFRLWAASHAGLAPDETYYWLWSRTPAFGYPDHPPMIAWWIWLSTRTLGDTALGIRVLPILSALVTSVAVYGTASQLWNRSTALRATLWFNAMILIGVGVILSTPDAPSTMFWALAVWALSAIFRTERPWLWILVGLFSGLGCVSKYTNFFLGLGIVLWLLIDPAGRRWFRSPWLWAGGIVACCVFWPVFLWNAQHDWISFSRQFGRIAPHTITLRYLGEFFVSQLGLLNPLVASFAFLAVSVEFKKRNEFRSNPSLFLFIIAVPLIVYMVAHALHDRVQANWLAPIYPQVAVLAASAADDLGARLRGLRNAVVPLGLTVSTIALVYLARPFDLPLPFRSPVERLEGWGELATNVERLRQQSGAVWIATANYDLTAELTFYIRRGGPVRQITERERYSYNPIDSGLAFQPALLVIPERDSEMARLKTCFETTLSFPLVARQGSGGIIERYVVEGGVTVQPDIMNVGCHLHSHDRKTSSHTAPMSVLIARADASSPLRSELGAASATVAMCLWQTKDSTHVGHGGATASGIERMQ